MKCKSLQLIKKWTLDHIQADPENVNVSNGFTVSESGTIGISCNENPPLSVMYSDTDESPIILSKDKIYRSATFVKIKGKEYLVAASDENRCLYLWDIESRTSRKVFDPKLPTDEIQYMNIFQIDDTTIGYGEVYDSPYEGRRVFILKIDIDEWTLSATLKLFIPGYIWDMCYIEVDGATPCVLLCVPYDNRVMAVEMISGKTRWEAGKEQMGEEFWPWSICTDEDNTVYVADFCQDKIHLLLATDGSVIKQIDVGGFYGINNIVCVGFHNQHLYIEWKLHTEKVKKYAILKFKQIKEM